MFSSVMKDVSTGVDARDVGAVVAGVVVSLGVVLVSMRCSSILALDSMAMSSLDNRPHLSKSSMGAVVLRVEGLMMMQV